MNAVVQIIHTWFLTFLGQELIKMSDRFDLPLFANWLKISQNMHISYLQLSWDWLSIQLLTSLILVV